MSETIITNRPKLAELLTDAGVRGERCANFWRDDRTAWRFDVTATTAKIVRDFYDRRDLDLPQSYSRAFDALERGES